MQYIWIIICSLIVAPVCAQTIIPESKIVDWSTAGYQSVLPVNNHIVDVTDFGAEGNGIADDHSAIVDAVHSLSSNHGGTIYFPEGTYFIQSPIHLPSNIVLKGESKEKTILRFDLSNFFGNRNAIEIRGTASELFIPITDGLEKGSVVIEVQDASTFSEGDYADIRQDGGNLTTDSWAFESVGQIVQIEQIVGNQLFLADPLRLTYTEANPRIQKITPTTNVGIECLQIERIDETPNQTANILFWHAAQCWVKGIESNHCNFTHIDITRSTNIEVSDSYFHHAFDYGEGGKGYGVTLQYASGQCLIENNYFQHLRHSMLVQAGANGNVLGYNYSVDPYNSVTFNVTGDIVLHGNYPYANLFEGNIVQNIFIDNAHGKNGPYNTFFRNRAELYGIVMTNHESNNQNFVGNEVTNPSIAANYTLLGSGHFEYANNIKGSIYPTQTTSLNDLSYYCTEKPEFWFSEEAWPAVGIGSENPFNEGNIPASKQLITAPNSLEHNNTPNGTSINWDEHIHWNRTNCTNIQYEYQICTSNQFDEETITGTTSSSESMIQSVLSSTTYYWRVRTISGNDTSLWSITNQFITPDQTSITSINGLSNEKTTLKLYPNPATHCISMHDNGAVYHNARIQIVDISGREVYASDITNIRESMFIDIQHLKKGVYVLLVTDGQQSNSVRFVKN